MSENGANVGEPIRIDFSHDSPAVVVTFGSLHIKKDVIPFEWTKLLKDLPVKKIYLRDLYQLWYQKGLPGIADSPDGVSDYLRELILRQDGKKIITVGSSMGGYAALLFGHLLGASEAHAFGGQTFLPTRKGRILARTIVRRRWPILRKNWELVSSREVQRTYFDLRPLLMEDDRQTRYHLYYSDNNEKDAAHARHVEDLANVRLHLRPDEGHHITRSMKKSGELDRVLRQAVSED